MAQFRRLIVNADDFGLSDGVNHGILKAHESGIVTSTSLMVRAPAAAQAATSAASFPSLSVGLHLDLGEWRFEAGEWAPNYERAPLDDARLLHAEVAAQFSLFERLTGTQPTHVDSHQHAHRNEPLRTIVTAKAAELGIPVRHFTPSIHYLGDFYGQDEEGRPYPERVTAGFLSSLIGALRDGTTELCCHPAEDVDFDSAYATERVKELEALCDPLVLAAVDSSGVVLRSFSNFERDPE